MMPGGQSYWPYLLRWPGLRNARGKGVRLGRPPGSGVAPQVRHAQAAQELMAGEPASVVAVRHGLSTRTVWRIKASMASG
jgi:hypothetical protein